MNIFLSRNAKKKRRVRVDGTAEKKVHASGLCRICYQKHKTIKSGSRSKFRQIMVGTVRESEPYQHALLARVAALTKKQALEKKI